MSKIDWNKDKWRDKINKYETSIKRKLYHIKSKAKPIKGLHEFKLKTGLVVRAVSEKQAWFYFYSRKLSDGPCSHGIVNRIQ